MNRTKNTFAAILAVGGTLALSACADYVKRDEFDAAIAQLRQSDDALSQRIDALANDLRARMDQQNTRISEMNGRLRIETVSHFAFDDATLRERDKPQLDTFAEVIREHHPNVLITVEGFTDPAGSVSYNKKLGLRRAEAVRGRLIDAGGLRPEQVRVVSYGEDDNRLIEPDAWGADRGESNRRVALVVDYLGRS